MSEGRQVIVSAAARLHLGFLDLNGGVGRRFGSIGLAIDGPRLRLSLQHAKATRAHGPDCERAQRHLLAMRHHFKTNASYALSIGEAIPAHAGLGSGTCLALSVATAFRRLEGIAPDLRTDAKILSRGERSGVGLAVFRKGGFVVDGGRDRATVTPPLVARLPFPRDWRILLIQDSSKQGIHGDEEHAAFTALARHSEASADQICRLVLMQLLPGLAEKRIDPFGQAVGAIQRCLGDYFAPRQGGQRFASPEVGAVLEALELMGAHGIGQSSWGPTGFAFTETHGEAKRLCSALRAHPAASGLDISIRRGLNGGAQIKSGQLGSVGRALAWRSEEKL
jgi:beta-ribofuranosylaminobenzene 5'-phosphate synthase